MSTFQCFVLMCLSAGIFLLGIMTLAYVKSRAIPILRGKVESASGDNEGMSFTFDILAGETEDSKESKIAEAWRMIQDRKDENHEKWLAIKAQAIKENEETLAGGGKLSLKSVTEN